MAKIKTVLGGLPKLPKLTKATTVAMPRFLRKPGMASAIPSMPKASGLEVPALSFNLKKRTVKVPK